MSVSEVSICNGGLIHLGQATLTSLTDGNTVGTICNQRYPFIRDKLLRSHPWKFATVRTNLAADTAKPEYNWDYQYQEPTDCLRVLKLKDPEIIWIKEGSKILTNESGPLYIKYLRRVTNPTEFDASFVELLSVEIAINLCVKLTNSPKLINSTLEPMRQTLLNEARSIGAVEGWSDQFWDEGTWVRVRD